jgi:hypothetical protein
MAVNACSQKLSQNKNGNKKTIISILKSNVTTSNQVSNQ